MNEEEGDGYSSTGSEEDEEGGRETRRPGTGISYVPSGHDRVGAVSSGDEFEDGMCAVESSMDGGVGGGGTEGGSDKPNHVKPPYSYIALITMAVIQVYYIILNNYIIL